MPEVNIFMEVPPCAGGPAGSMEGGRQAEIAKSILGSMNVPYIVAAPLLIQACLMPFPYQTASCPALLLATFEPNIDFRLRAVPLRGGHY